MGDCTLWIKWLFLAEYRQVTAHVKTGWAYRNLNRDIQQGQMPSPAPGTDKLRGCWHSLRNSSAEKDQPRSGWAGATAQPCSKESWGMDPQQHSQGCNSTAPWEHSTREGSASTGQASGNWEWVQWKATKPVTGWNTRPGRTEDAGLLQPAEGTALGWELK